MISTAYAQKLLMEAGSVALRYFRNVEPMEKQDRSYVTAADLEIQDYLNETLFRLCPDDGIIAEEANFRRDPKNGNTYWVIDPIDGTSAFVNGLPVWGISLGILKDDQPFGGFFYMPATGDFYAIQPNGPALRNGQPAQMRQTRTLHRESLLLTQSTLHRREYVVQPTYPGKVQGYGSCVAHLCLLATGSADAVLIGRAKIWDLVVGWAMLKRNGGVFQTLNGGQGFCLSELMQGQPLAEPMLVGRESTIAQYRDYLESNRDL